MFALSFGVFMHNIKKARMVIESDPYSPSSQILASLVRSLESSEHFDIKNIYDLKSDDFELAIQVLRDWRLDRYYLGKAKIFDAAVQVSQIVN
jgi:hypothetical protein